MTLAMSIRGRTFVAVAAAAVALEGVLAASALGHKGPVPVAVVVDLVLVLPLAYYLVMLRPARRHWLEVAPVLTVGVVLAGLLVRGAPTAHVPLRAASVAAEVVVLSYLAHRLRLAARTVSGVGDDDLLGAAAALDDRLMRVAATELAVLRYAFSRARSRPPHAAGPPATPFSYVEASGLTGLLAGAAVLIAVEALVAHAVLHGPSPRAAWVHTALSAYGLVWLRAVHVAAVVRPVLVTPDDVLVRTSLLWTASVPRASIVRVDAGCEAPRSREVLRAALLVAPNVLLTLSHPVVARGVLGLSRSVSRIALYVDDPAGFVAALQ